MPTEITDTHCPTLPSSESAYNFIQGRPGSTIRLVRDLFARSVLVGVGMAVAGEREHLFRNAFAGAVGIEVFVLGWVWLNAPAAPQTALPPASGLPTPFVPAPAPFVPAPGWYRIPAHLVSAYQALAPVACVKVQSPYWPYVEDVYCARLASRT